MEWIIPVIAIIVLVAFAILLFNRKPRPGEISGLLLVLLSMILYHIGDAGLWAGKNYELVRRIASVGFYFELPMMILLLYYLVPKDKRTIVFRVLATVLIIPWVIALVLVGSNPLVYLEPMGGASEELMYALVLCFILGVVFIAVYGFKAAKWHEDLPGKKLSRTYAIATIVLIVLYLIIWSSIDAFGYDATWLFGLANIVWAAMMWKATK